MTTGKIRKNVAMHRSLVLIGLLIAAAAVPFYRVSSASFNRHAAIENPRLAAVKGSESTLLSRVRPTRLLMSPAMFDESVATFDADCVTPKSDFVLGDIVCSKASGVPVTSFPWHVFWGDPEGFIRQADEAIADDQATYSYTLPSTATSTVAGKTVDNRGTWTVNLARSDGAIRQSARFVVHDVAQPAADVFVKKFERTGGNAVGQGGNIAFIIIVGNNGPDLAATVNLVDVVPAGSLSLSFTQQSGPACLPAGAGNCTMATMANGERAEFTAIYDTGTSAQGDYTTSATVTNVTPDPDTSNNTATASFSIGANTTGSGCSLTCPTNITVDANSTEGGQRGAHVTYSEPIADGTCGSVSSIPASGSFFPVGTTVVTGTSETGNGSCQFTVTVEETNDNVSITCPGNMSANADNDCEAAVAVGSPSATGDNVTVFATRSDGRPMYNCDGNGNCTRRAQDDPFPAGVTTITWTATAHNAQGPYQSEADEESHRTGNASCQQTVTVNDVTPAAIGATDQVVSADADCQATVPDYSNTVSDNCACSSSDTSEACLGHPHFTVTQNPAPGTVVGIGPHSVVITANDGSSNNDGAGNTSTKTITFTVADTTAPAITCPASITRSNDPGSCSASVNPGTATATDNCDGSPTITGTRSDGQPLNAPYPKGATTITWTATDDANNSSSCTQTVTVNDTEAPTVTCPANVTRGTDPGTCSATFNAGTATASDNCPGATVNGVRSDGQPLNAPYPKGTTTITWTATDASGNHSASCTQTVTVIDNEAPVITTNGQTLSMWPPNHKYQTFQVTNFVTGASDNCTTIGVSNVVIEKVTSDEIENGNGDGNTTNDIVIAANCKSVQLRSEREGNGNGRVYTITFKVADAAGNVGRATAKVVVPHNPGETPVDSGVHYTVNGTCP
jgi:uncharacterized repeat protein (TIGR01451 family)